MANGQTVPAGWYQMQSDAPNTHRWWDGVQWTSETQVIGVAAPVPAQVAPTAVESPFAQSTPPVAAVESRFAQAAGQPAQPLAVVESPFAQPIEPAAAAQSAPAQATPAIAGLDSGGFAQTTQQPAAAIPDGAFAQPTAQAVPVAAAVAAQPAEPAVEYGSMLTNDLASYWDKMEEPVDAAAKFAETSALAAQNEAEAKAKAEAEAAEQDSSKRRRFFGRKKSSKDDVDVDADVEAEPEG